MHRPPADPIGLLLISAAQVVSRALDDALTLDGGSLSMWRVLVSRKDEHPGPHPDRSEAVGVIGGTWSDELSRMEIAGLVVSGPDPQNPAPGVDLTEAGEALFHRLLRTVVAFDRRLRTGLTDQEITSFTSALGRLRRNLADEEAEMGGIERDRIA